MVTERVEFFGYSSKKKKHLLFLRHLSKKLNKSLSGLNVKSNEQLNHPHVYIIAGYCILYAIYTVDDRKRQGVVHL